MGATSVETSQSHYQKGKDSLLEANARLLRSSGRELALTGKVLKKKVASPFTSNYRPELDATPESDHARRASYYMSLMGVLRWCIELGQVDVIVEVGLLARFQACRWRKHDWVVSPVSGSTTPEASLENIIVWHILHSHR